MSISGEKREINLPESSGVIQSPDGTIQYYCPEDLKNKYNPYLQVSSNNDLENNSNYIPIVCNGETILILQQDLNKAITLENKASLVRLICLIDFLMNFYISLSIPYSNLSTLIASLISLSGYYSTYTYSKLGLICYLFYQYMLSISRIGLLTFFIIIGTSNEFKEKIKNNSIIIFDPNSGNILILSLMTLAQLYITYFIQRFYNLLPNTNSSGNIRYATFA